jgi:Mn-dependent DtxR family transcriptional regulator
LEDIHTEADKIEHVMSDVLEAKVDQALGFQAGVRVDKYSHVDNPSFNPRINLMMTERHGEFSP